MNQHHYARHAFDAHRGLGARLAGMAGLDNPFSPTAPNLTDANDLAGITAITTALANMTNDGQASAFASVTGHPGGKSKYFQELATVGGAALIVGFAAGWFLHRRK